MIKKILSLLTLCIFAGNAYGQNIDFTRLNNKTVSYERLINTPKAILFLWTTWCPGCRSEISRLSRKCDTKPPTDNNVEMFFVNEGENESTVRRFFKVSKLNECVSSRVLMDPGAYLARKFSIPGVPTYIFIIDGAPAYRSHYLNEDLISEVFSLDQ